MRPHEYQVLIDRARARPWHADAVTMLRLVLVDDGEVIGVPTSAQYIAATPVGDGRRSIVIDGRAVIIETRTGHPRELMPDVRAHAESRRAL
jgi:hypothetical protein